MRLCRPLAAATLACVLCLPGTEAKAQREDPTLAEVIGAMTPRQRVGQLFIVPFEGADAGPGSAIATLIEDYYVGGVILDAARGNLDNGLDTPAQVARLTNALQAAAARSGMPPLLVATAQQGDAYPASAIRGGMTPLPSPMAIGATWDPDNARRVGHVVGREMAAVGANLLLGPNLDVTSQPQAGSPGDLGSRVFGGSPHWVGQMGAAFVEGVRAGGRGRVATAVGHFPGIGAADRSADQEVAVVEQTFPGLLSGELAPFAAVAEPSLPAGSTEALVTSHVRYTAVQQRLERPLSLDSGGLRYLIGQVPNLAAWRQRGGVLISPGLGLPAVRRYDDPNLGSFNHRRVLREALAAGHDILMASGLDQGGDASAIRDGIEWLAGEYAEDEAIQEAVDSALVRVLGLKRRLYPGVRGEAVRVDAEAAGARTGLGTEDVQAVAREALTRISPQSGGAQVGGSPQTGDDVLFVVDGRPVAPCRDCEPVLALNPARVTDIARRLYGRAGTNRIADESVNAITYSELKAWLQVTGAVHPEDTVAFVAEPAPERLAEVSRLVGGADWLIFFMRDVRPAEAVGSDALKLYLKASAADDSGRRLVAFAFDAPYYLDATEIAKLSAYYAVYARSEPFVDAAVRALFGDVAPLGASPVSVPGAGYDLPRRLEPASESVQLELVGREAGAEVETGSSLVVRTSVVYDANGHLVPDGTSVNFRRFVPAEGLFLPDVPAQTESGRAAATMRVERAAEIELSAHFANGLRSAPLVVAVVGDPTDRTAVTPSIAEPGPAAIRRPTVDWGILVLSLGMVLAAGVCVHALDAEAGRTPSRLLRLSLLSACWGLVGYLLVVAGGLDLAALGAGRLWPDGWNGAYQAPLMAGVFGLLPVLPVVRFARAGAAAGVTPTLESLPGGKDRQQE